MGMLCMQADKEIASLRWCGIISIKKKICTFCSLFGLSNKIRTNYHFSTLTHMYNALNRRTSLSTKIN